MSGREGTDRARDGRTGRPVRRSGPGSALPLLLLAALLGGAAVRAPCAGAQEAALVPVWDPAYQDLARLEGAGLLPRSMMGRRPFSVGRLTALVGEARDALPDLEERLGSGRLAGLRDVLERLERRFPAAGPEVSGLLLRDVLLDLTEVRSPPRSTLGSNGRGEIDDVENPLLAYQEGRRQLHGSTAGLEVSLLAAAPSFALEVRPRGIVSRLAGVPEGEDATESDYAVRRLYGRLRLGKWAVRVGRDAVVWAQGDRTGMLLSTNARGLDMVELATDAPVRLPGFLGGLGPSAFTLFVADLGEDQRFPHTKLVGARMSVKPHPRLELGFAYLNKQGGKGAPGAPFGDRILDILVLPDVVRSSADYEFSEKLVGGDLRWRLPTDVPTVLYLEGVLTDFDVGRFGQILWMDAAYQLGFLWPALGPSGRWWLRAEGQHVGNSVYRHGQFTSGLTLDGMVQGSALGPDADGLRVQVGRDTGSGAQTLEVDVEARRAHLYDSTPEPDFRVHLAQEYPVERRVRLMGGWSRYLGGGSGRLLAEAGAERVTAFGFAASSDRNNAFVRLSVQHRIR